MRRKKSWLARFSAAARWRLGAKEAEEVIADYREIIGDPPRTEEELMRDLGKPKDVVMQLTTPKAYYIWLVVFAALAVCPVLMAWDLLRVAVAQLVYWLTGQFLSGFWYDLMREAQQLALLLLGLILSFVWFQRRGWKGKGRLPGGVLPRLGVLTVLIVLAWGFWFWMCWIAERGTAITSAEGAVFRTMQLVLAWCSLTSCAAALAGLVKARTGDRRWRAVYALGLTATAALLAVNAVLNNMDMSTGYSFWWSPETRHILLVTVLGLIGTGAALC